MKSKINFIFILLTVFTLIFFPSCKRNAIEQPSPLGPSTFSVVLNLSANPNALRAKDGTSREVSVIKATLKRFDGTPLAGKTIIFEVTDGTGSKIHLGYFENEELVQNDDTNINGVASVRYQGPILEEMLGKYGNMNVYIHATVAWKDYEFISNQVPIYIIRDFL